MNLEYASAALKKNFGYDAFRPLQADIIRAAYNRRDTLVLMPTGGGKSICFQVPAITLEGICIVISPLIALMKDQVEGLIANGVPAAFMNSSQGTAEALEVEEAALAGYLKLLYVSPEKLVSSNFRRLLSRIKISLFAIDEAHCISSWGHDFRPEYTQLRFLKDQYPQIPIMALTATADKLTRKDIVDQLGLDQPEVFIASFDRPNISLQVRPGQRRFEQIVEFLREHPGQSGIIYCLARKTCEDLAAKLNAKGFKAAFYHADIPATKRSQVQDDFINDRVPIVCATIAFGMGIDKSNVRFVVHYNLPRSLEGYYQEIGRAGRDGLAAKALLFFSFADVTTYREMFEQGDGAPEQKELKIAKLNRMFQFAESPTCRRQTVLNYFGEPYSDHCGNCDVCENPPRQFDGTTAIQKALSCMLRANETVGMNMLIDILRGSQRREIFENKYHEIKTYGAGKEYSYEEWLFLLSQMLHMGLIEIAYDDFSRLKVTPAGKSVLFDGMQMQMALPVDKEKIKKAKEEKMASFKTKTQTQVFREELFDLLVATRRQLAQKQGVPPYLIFSDATLQDMAEKKPISDAEILRISGVGERKLQLYGDAFLAEIRKFVLEKKESGANIAGSTILVTWESYRDGETVEEIAQSRNLSTITIMNHLAIMYERGESIDFSRWVGPEEMDIIQGALTLFDEPYQMKEIHEHFKERFNYEKIRWAIADYKRRSTTKSIS
jgi:ATP-dependent DNA helicase RecQ